MKIHQKHYALVSIILNTFLCACYSSKKRYKVREEGGEGERMKGEREGGNA